MQNIIQFTRNMYILGNVVIEKFKFFYVAEIGYGPLKLYGSYSPKSIVERSLDMRPYNFGIRFSSW